MIECDSAPAAVSESSQTAAGASAQASSTGSFEYAITVDERLCCPICQAPMQDPWMSKTCEHVYCYECIIQHLAGSDGAGTCPCDRSPLRLDLDLPSEKRQLVPALRLVKLLCDELPVRCTSSPSCKWTGQRSHWQRHYDHDCIKPAADACPNECGYRGKDVAKHQNDTCPRRPFECPACQGYIASSEFKVREYCTLAATKHFGVMQTLFDRHTA